MTPLLAAGKQGMEIAFAADPKVYDGRFANNVWLQELPHPITKLTWENAAMMSEATAKALDLEDGDVVEITYRDRHVEAPIMRVPGHADDAVTLPLGYGRTGAEKVAAGVGFNAGALRVSDALWFDRGVTLAKTDRQVEFSITQDHWTMAPDGRDTPPPAVEAHARRGAERRGRSSTRRSRSAARPGAPAAGHPQAGRLQRPAVQVGDGDRHADLAVGRIEDDGAAHALEVRGAVRRRSPPPPPPSGSEAPDELRRWDAHEVAYWITGRGSSARCATAIGSRSSPLAHAPRGGQLLVVPTLREASRRRLAARRAS